MKRHIVLIICLLSAVVLKSQTVSCRYWFDFDHGQTVTTTLGSSIWQAEMDVGPLPDGVHTLHFQTYNTSMAWSAPQSFPFFKLTPPAQTDVVCHYWFDEDDANLQSSPIGNGMLPLNAIDISEGIHTLHVVVEGNGLSATQSFLFLKMEIEPEAVELRYHYWFDDDDAHLHSGLLGNGLLFVDAFELSEGQHILHIIIEGNKMTATESFEFTRRENAVLSCRYWFDFDHEQAVITTFQSNSWQSELDVEALSDGIHTLHLHTSDTVRAWSAPQSFHFFKLTPPIEADVVCHYWFDENDGNVQTRQLGNGLLPLDVSSLSEGIHTLHVVMEGNDFSSTQSFVFMKMDIEPVAAEVHYHYWFDQDDSNLQSGLYSDGILPLDVTHLPEGIHALHVMMEGSGLSSVQSFLFLRMAIEPESVDVHYHYWFDEDDANLRSGLLGDGLIIVDAFDLDDGPHSLNIIVEGNKMTAPQSFEFVRWANLFFVGSVNTFWSELGNWRGSSSWSGTSLPGIGDNIVIEAPYCTLNQDAAVDNLYVPEGNILTLQSGNTLIVETNLANSNVSGLIIEDGAQLVNASENVAATMKKEIIAYSDSATRCGWYTIASPMNDMSMEGSDFLAADYDLYRFIETKLDDEEWENYKELNNQNFSTFERGCGYIYANSHTFTPAFAGMLNNAEVVYPLTFTNRPYDWYDGFNLIGNPFPHVIYKGEGGAIDNDNLASGYYTLTNEGSWHVHTFDEAIQPGQGIFVKTLRATELNIAKTTAVATAESISGSAVKGQAVPKMTVTVSGRAGSDRAIAYFCQGKGLNKMSNIFDNAPTISIQGDDGNYAIAHVTGDCGFLKLQFDNKQSGDFTLSIHVDETPFVYLHLIDAENGADIDLLQSPSYVFQANGSENVDRFKVVFK